MSQGVLKGPAEQSTVSICKRISMPLNDGMVEYILDGFQAFPYMGVDHCRKSAV
jgi:hypothetical protein